MIRVRFSTKNTLFARLIGWFTREKYSHFEFVLDNGLVLGADNFEGVCIKDAGPYLRYEDFLIDAPDSVLQRAKSQVGKGYDWWAVLSFLTRRNWEKEHRWTCSELGAWCFAQEGVPLLRTEDLYKVSPRDLLMSPLLRKS